MNIRLLIAGILVFFLFSCRTITETASYGYQNMSININTDSISDIRFNEILAPYKEKVEAEMSEVIAYSDNGFTSYRPESPLSNFLSDLILDFGKNFAAQNAPEVQVQISLFNHGGIRASIPKGEVKVYDAYQIMPFENELVLLLLSGRQVVSLADYICIRGGEGVAGISFGMMSDKAVDIKIEGLQVDVNKKYWLITSDYIANGGDGMKVLTWAEKRIDTGYLIRDVMIGHFKQMNNKGQKVNAVSDGRIYHVE
ncbi:MAG TPA: 5'-nucleotidase C-terminal domain-containing protein [Prolixibacteraceae bacterium]|nr:5'-nucleotidase C-terminal domain-containing protein [Prolixibacteraceae bacterium]